MGSHLLMLNFECGSHSFGVVRMLNLELGFGIQDEGLGI